MEVEQKCFLSHSNISQHIYPLGFVRQLKINTSTVHRSCKTCVVLAPKRAVICHCGTCHSVKSAVKRLRLLCFVYIRTTHHDVCEIFAAAQRIVGQNGQKCILACILQNLTGCSRTSRYFWHTVFHILSIETYKIFLW